MICRSVDNKKEIFEEIKKDKKIMLLLEDYDIYNLFDIIPKNDYEVLSNYYQKIFNNCN